MLKKESLEGRIFLLILGWESLIGSIIESVVLLHAVWLIIFGQSEWDMTVQAHLYEHLQIFTWLVKLAYALFPDDVVSHFLSWPVLVFYPVRVTASVLIGGWALSTAKRMKIAMLRRSVAKK